MNYLFQWIFFASFFSISTFPSWNSLPSLFRYDSFMKKEKDLNMLHPAFQIFILFCFFRTKLQPTSMFKTCLSSCIDWQEKSFVTEESSCINQNGVVFPSVVINCNHYPALQVSSLWRRPVCTQHVRDCGILVPSKCSAHFSHFQWCEILSDNVIWSHEWWQLLLSAKGSFADYLKFLSDT